MDSEIAPMGTFRVGMNGNNTTLVIRGADGTVSGLSADLGRFIAGKLGVPYEPVVYASAAPYTASFGKSEWDIILTGRNAVVAKLVDFSADLFLIDYVYVAAHMARIQHLAIASLNPEKQAEFYKKVFGFKEVRRLDNPRAWG